MDRKLSLGGACALAVVGTAAGVWSITSSSIGTSSREFGRVGMSVAPEPPEGEGRDGAFEPGAQPEGERAIRVSPEDLPEGMRALVAGDGMDRSSFSFPTIRDESDAREMFRELRDAIAAKAPGATAYRQAPPIGKQRFTESAVRFTEPFIIASLRPEDDEAPRASARIPGRERGLGGAFYGSATTLASLDIAHLRISDAAERLAMQLPPEVLEGLPQDAGTGAGDGERRLEMSFVTSGGGWSRHESSHPMAAYDIERPQGQPMAQLSLPLQSARLGEDVLDARLDITMWWDESSQLWRPGNTTLRYMTEESQDDGPTRRRRTETQR